MPRHWFDEAKRVDFPDSEMQAIIDKTLGNIDSIIENVSSRLPVGFPEQIAGAIFNGIAKVTRKFSTK